MAKKISAARATKTAKGKRPAAPLPKAPPVSRASEENPASQGAAAATPKAPPIRANALFEEHPPIPSAFALTASAVRIIARYWQIFLGVAVAYAALNIVFIQGMHVASNITTLQKAASQVPGGFFGRLGDGVSLVATLIGSGGNSVAPTSGPYQLMMAVVASLALIWFLREAFAGHQFSFRDGFYKGMAPLMTFLLTGLVVLAHLLPLAAGAAIYSIVVANAIASGPFLQLVFMTLFLVLAAISLYLVSSSLFAMYIVTLPGMTPWAATRTARDLVAHRRFTIIRKLLFLPFLLLLVCIVVLLPFVLWIPVAAAWVFTVLAALLLVFAHSYLYTLYRALI
ncbi:MAG TPA: hypothetical protein VLF71_01480 [Candidatus Saccharimonadales bacterium]|nr:hypothetical protein [Candidatus Saccharimonadales bacterium]